MNTQHEVKFDLGQIVATPGALEALGRNHSTGLEFLQRHARGDWGVVCEEDKQANNDALQSGARILSAYVLPTDEEKIWIITEAADDNGHRAATTLILPDEY